jgi:hypothetical protein
MQFNLLLSFSLLLLLAPAGSAADNTTRIPWGDLSSMVAPGHVFRIVLPDGVRVEGRPLELQPESLVLDVTRTSNKKLHPKGRMAVPRDSLRVVEVRSPRSKGRWIGTLAGAAPGIAILAAGATMEEDARIYILLAGAGATAAGLIVGFFTGRAIDRRFQKFVIASPWRARASLREVLCKLSISQSAAGACGAACRQGDGLRHITTTSCGGMVILPKRLSFFGRFVMRPYRGDLSAPPET